MREGTATFPTREHAARSPLATHLYEIDGITGVFFGADFITVTKADDQHWAWLKPPILGAIMEHFTSGRPLMEDEHTGAGVGTGSECDETDIGVQEPVSDTPQELIDQVQKLIEERLYPAVHGSGGDIEFHSFVGGTVNLRLQGSAHAMLSQIEDMLRHNVPEIEKVQDVMDAMPKPGLDTEGGKTFRRLLDERINPQVASHGARANHRLGPFGNRCDDDTHSSGRCAAPHRRYRGRTCAGDYRRRDHRHATTVSKTTIIASKAIGGETCISKFLCCGRSCQIWPLIIRAAANLSLLLLSTQRPASGPPPSQEGRC
jgi:Fe-S cluster biogenesis protein NfuA